MCLLFVCYPQFSGLKSACVCDLSVSLMRYVQKTVTLNDNRMKDRVDFNRFKGMGGMFPRSDEWR
jgi:hypothetical protein